MSSLPADLAVAPGPADDFEELWGFVRDVNIAQSGRPNMNSERLRSVLSAPEFDPRMDLRVIRDASGALVGAAWVQSRAPFVRHHGYGFVTPGRLGEGIGSHLIDWQIARATERLDEAEAGTRVAITILIEPAHGPSVELASNHGFTPERYFAEMRIDFGTEAVELQPPPEGVRIRLLDPEEDVEGLVATIQEAFRDHYGFIERPIEDSMARFRRFMDRPDFDPTLVWLAMDGNDMAGSNICTGEHEDDTAVGYVGNIAVRRPWRGLGLAKAMLTLSFAELQRRGKTAVVLHVDADNSTGATQLYESVGMHETHRDVDYQRELRPGKDIVVS